MDSAPISKELVPIYRNMEQKAKKNNLFYLPNYLNSDVIAEILSNSSTNCYSIVEKFDENAGYEPVNFIGGQNIDLREYYEEFREEEVDEGREMGSIN